MQDLMAFKEVSRGLFILILALIGSGCASVVYKDAATTYVAAGRQAGKQLEASSRQLDAAQDVIRFDRITSDASCPIRDERLFVRNGDGDPETVAAALKRFENQAALDDCKQLLRCEQSSSSKKRGAPATCASACYSSSERSCLTQLESSYAIALKGAANQPVDQRQALQQESSRFLTLLERTEYRRAGSVESLLVGSGVRDLSEYMDLLAKVAEERKSEYPEDAKALSTRLSSLSKSVSEGTGKKLSAASQETQTQVNSAIEALGNFAGVVQKMAQDAQDASTIKKLVNANEVNVEDLIGRLRAVALGDTNLAAVYSQQAAQRARARLQAKFKSTANAYDRSLLLAARDKYLNPEGDADAATVTQIFDSLSKSHQALVSLVNDPTDEQKIAIANERLQNFKTVVVALADVIQKVK
ncbi:hypothetical protein [Pseudomonas fluorescens]|uniref:Uncharacterized protein n=1 Tax=Pseudomonas fluorescens TaxID=294 RepID=A0A423MBQ3_PSEFL|nr:hypothetical protein [Pseudomonas fluorescens]RON80691.1 hypothetical protein BK670_10835 [Pseudomonas fluorescens]